MVSRSVYSVNYNSIQGVDHRSGWCEMDSHADTCVAGSNCVVLEFTGRYAEVEAYLLDYPSKQIPITTVATAYDCPTSGAIFILISINLANLSPFLSSHLTNSETMMCTSAKDIVNMHQIPSLEFIFRPNLSRYPLLSVEWSRVLTHDCPHKMNSIKLISNAELTSDVEWISSSFALSLAEEYGTDSDDN